MAYLNIDRNECIGDSLGKINYNAADFDSRLGTLANTDTTLTTYIQTVSSQVYRSGATLQTVMSSSSIPQSFSNADGVTIYGPGNLTTIPTNTNGIQIITLPITPTYSNSRIVGSISIPIAINSGNRVAVVAFFRNNEVNAFDTAIHESSYGNMSTNLNVIFTDTATSTSPVIYRVRVAHGGGGNGTYYINQSYSGGTVGGTLGTQFTISEVRA